MACLLSSREGGGDRGRGDPRNDGTQRAPSRLVQGRIVSLSIDKVKRPIEEGSPACRRHRQLVDRRIGVALCFQVRLGDTTAPDQRCLSDDDEEVGERMKVIGGGIVTHVGEGQG